MGHDPRPTFAALGVPLFQGQNLRIALAVLATCTAVFSVSLVSLIASYITGFVAMSVATWFAYGRLVKILGQNPISLCSGSLCTSTSCDWEDLARCQ